MSNYMKEKATDKALSTIQALEKDIEIIEDTIKRGSSDEASIETLIHMKEFIQFERDLWSYILETIEKSDVNKD